MFKVPKLAEVGTIVPCIGWNFELFSILPSIARLLDVLRIPTGLASDTLFMRNPTTGREKNIAHDLMYCTILDRVRVNTEHESVYHFKHP